MKIPELKKCILLKRYKRFFMDVELENGEGKLFIFPTLVPCLPLGKRDGQDITQK